MDNMLPKLWLAGFHWHRTHEFMLPTLFCTHLVPLDHLFGKPSSSSQACMDENGLVLQWRPTYWVSWLKETRATRNCWIIQTGWFCRLLIRMVMSIVMSAIAFGGKPEAIMWKVKTIVGEKGEKFVFNATVVCRILINWLTLVIFIYMKLLYLSNNMYVCVKRNLRD